METQYRKVKKYFTLLEQHLFENEMTVENIAVCPCGYKKGHTPPPLSDFKPYTVGEDFGDGFDSHVWFHMTVTVPENMRKKPVILYIASDKEGGVGSNPQFLLYIDGEIVQGLDVRHREVPLRGDGPFDVYVYAYTGARIKTAKLFASIKNLNTVCRDLYYDIKVPLEILEFTDKQSVVYAETLTHLDKALSLLDLYDLDSENFYASMEKARAYMQNEFYGKYCGNVNSSVSCIGHTHIDCAWLWTLRQTREKVQRSFATVLALMKEYPEYKFMSSQALLYKKCKEEAPALYEQIKERVKEQRWECEGAMWVEADCNLTSGESLCRQILYGKRFFKDEFGVNNRVLWLPDAFGYSAALPQILKKSGVDWFVTSKISWNDTNTMPYDTFKWYGIDGTPVNTHFLTAQDMGGGRGTIYNARITPSMVAGAMQRYHQKNISNETLLTYGYGDGGGGPTREHLEVARRLEKGIPGAPQVKLEFAGDYLARMEEKMEGNPLVPSWHGELYLEFHRGTYTSIAKNKRNNRKSEFLYLTTEAMSTAAKYLADVPYPKEKLHAGWESILTNQFHDIVPGSSIREVYEQSDIDYRVLQDSANAILENAASTVASALEKGGYAVFNPNSFRGSGLVKLDGVSSYVRNIPPHGYALVRRAKQENRVKIDGRTVETDKLTVHFDENYLIDRIFDKENAREVLQSGCVGNEIRIYPDHPDAYDAWEWQEYSLDEYKVLTEVSDVEIIDDGARRGIRIVRPCQHSTITQTMWFTDETAKIDFDTVCDWHEHHLMVKAVFPVDINADKATFEIQYGTLERPTHKNTSWDKAKFETCAHKYADLSDGSYGVSLLNDCKYGYDIHDGTMQLSLLKCATSPNEVADQGEMRCVYSLYPHAGTLTESDTVRLAYDLNNPMFAAKTTGEKNILPAAYSLVSVNCKNVICEAVKEAEDSDATVLRLYECENKKGDAEITFGFPVAKCYLCDILENEEKELPVCDGKVTLPVRGFDILTLKCKT